MTPPPGFPPAGVTASKGFDKQNHNQVFAQRLDTPVASGKCITSASLVIRLTPTPPDNPADDTINLQAGTAKYVAYLGKPGSVDPPTLLPASWNTVQRFTFTLDVDPLLADITANQYLDVTVEDDTGVDYIKWDTKVCPCAARSPTRVPNASAAPVTAPGSGAPTITEGATGGPATTAPSLTPGSLATPAP